MSALTSCSSHITAVKWLIFFTSFCRIFKVVSSVIIIHLYKKVNNPCSFLVWSWTFIYKIKPHSNGSLALHGTGPGTGPGNDGSPYYAMYCTLHRDRDRLPLFSIVPVLDLVPVPAPGPVPCIVPLGRTVIPNVQRKENSPPTLC